MQGRPLSRQQYELLSDFVLLLRFDLVLRMPEWEQCYWCAYWEIDAFRCHCPECFDEPLCNWCLEWSYYKGGPYEPNARQRATRLLHHWFNTCPYQVSTPSYQVDELVCVQIAEFLIDWHVP